MAMNNGRPRLSSSQAGQQTPLTTVADSALLPATITRVQQGYLPGTVTAVYRFYTADLALLWIGMTNNVVWRADQHRRESPWFHFAARCLIELYPDRATARLAEVAAIQAESPAYNKLNRRLAA